MNNWIGAFYFFIIGASLLLSVMGLWFTILIPGIDRWSKRFFLVYFIVLLLSSLFVLIDLVLFYYPVPSAAIYFLLILETLRKEPGLRSVTVTAEVSVQRTVTASADRPGLVYYEGETAQISVALSKRDFDASCQHSLARTRDSTLSIATSVPSARCALRSTRS